MLIKFFVFEISLFTAFSHKRSDRTCPSERAAERVLQLLFCGAQERWRTDNGPEALQPSASQAQVQDDNAEADPGTNLSQGLVCIHGSDGCILPHSDRNTPQALPEVVIRGHSIPVFSSSFRAGFSPMHVLEVHRCRASGMCILNDLDDWLILAHSRDVLISHMDKLHRHLGSLGLQVNVQKSVFTPSQSITYLGAVVAPGFFLLRVLRRA